MSATGQGTCGCPTPQVQCLLIYSGVIQMWARYFSSKNLGIDFFLVLKKNIWPLIIADETPAVQYMLSRNARRHHHKGKIDFSPFAEEM